MSKNEFVHLHLHSQYSLLDGAIKFDDLFEEVKKQGMPAVALTDHGNLFGAYDFYKKAKENNVKPIIGCEVYISKDHTNKTPEDNKTHHLTVLAMNMEGYQNLCSLVTKGHLKGFYRKPRLDKKLLFENNIGLIVLSGCLNSEVCHNILKGKKEEAIRIASEYKAVFGDRYFLEIQGTKLKEQKRVNSVLIEMGAKLNIPIVATNDCHYLTKHDFNSHDALLCIQTGSLVKEEKRFRFNGNEFYLKSREEMKIAIDDYEDALENTLLIAERCEIDLKTEDYHLPKLISDDGSTEINIKEMVLSSLENKIENKVIPSSKFEVYKKRIDHELSIIQDMGYEGYFLVVSDFIRFAKTHSIPVGPGRGSAAGSLVANLLEITEVDPVKYDLIFERFLNPERISMPDIDIDFCGEGREEVIKYVINKYGEDKVAQIGTFGTMSSKAVIKDVGRVLGFSFGDVNKLTNLIPSFRGKVYTLNECHKKVKEFRQLVESDEKFTELYNLSVKLENSVRHSSTHAAGVVISNDPLDKMIPLFRGSKDETVTQYDMNAVEELGFVKFDFLGLKTLTVIKKAKDFIKIKNSNIEEEIRYADMDNPDVYKMLSKGLTRGIFQIESSGMKDVLKNLRANKFDDIVALLALYRPGPLDSGMVDEYILRKSGKRKTNYPLPELEKILEETHGLFVYQEQIMKTASILANFSLGEADLLRRAMGKKKTSEMLAQRERFIKGAGANNLPPKITNEIFDTMEKFAEYSFNKSHSTAYANITFQTAYLKTYYPCEFMAALMSTEINLSEKIVANISESKEMGIEILSPDINESGSGFTPINNAIRFGLSAIKNLGTNIVESIIKSREGHDKFSTIFEFLSVMESRKMNKKSLESLIKSGCLDCFAYTRSTLYNNMDLLLSYVGQHSKNRNTEQENLFDIGDLIHEPELRSFEEWSLEELSKYEIETVGYSIKINPLEIYKHKLSQINYKKISDIKNEPEKSVITLAAYISSISVKTSKKNAKKYAMINLEDSTGVLDAIIFNDEFEKYESVLNIGASLLLTGSIERSDDNIKLIINSFNNVESIQLISEIPVPLKIVINDELSKEQVNCLRDIFNKYPGESPVEILLQNDGIRAKIAINNLSVENCEELHVEISKAISMS